MYNLMNCMFVQYELVCTYIGSVLTFPEGVFFISLMTSSNFAIFFESKKKKKKSGING